MLDEQRSTLDGMRKVLSVGSEPEIFNAHENATTGYIFSVEIADENVVRALKTSEPPPENSRRMCGVGRDIAYEFHAIGTGHTRALKHTREHTGRQAGRQIGRQAGEQSRAEQTRTRARARACTSPIRL